MEITIDLNVTFKLPGGRSATVDAEALNAFVRSVWEAGELREDGQRYLVIERDATPKLAQWVKEKTGIDLTPGEALGVWKVANAPPDAAGNGQDPWSQKKRSWDGPTATTPTSQPSTGPGSLDPRYMPDPDETKPITPA